MKKIRILMMSGIGFLLISICNICLATDKLHCNCALEDVKGRTCTCSFTTNNTFTISSDTSSKDMMFYCDQDNINTNKRVAAPDSITYTATYLGLPFSAAQCNTNIDHPKYGPRHNDNHAPSTCMSNSQHTITFAFTSVKCKVYEL